MYVAACSGSVGFATANPFLEMLPNYFQFLFLSPFPSKYGPDICEHRCVLSAHPPHDHGCQPTADHPSLTFMHPNQFWQVYCAYLYGVVVEVVVQVSSRHAKQQQPAELAQQTPILTSQLAAAAAAVKPAMLARPGEEKETCCCFKPACVCESPDAISTGTTTSVSYLYLENLVDSKTSRQNCLLQFF